MKLHNIYYVPGLISAILIPILFWFYANKKLNEPLPNVMDIGLPAKHEKNSKIDASFEPFRNWNYKKIVVKPNTARKNSKYYVSELKKIQEKNQNKTGIEFIIGKSNTYDDFISILNDMELAKQEHYTIDMDKTGHFFAVHIYKDPNKIEEPCNLCDDTIGKEFPDEYYLKGYQKFQYQLAHLPKQAFYIIFGYLFLLQISVLSLVRKSF